MGLCLFLIGVQFIHAILCHIQFNRLYLQFKYAFWNYNILNHNNQNKTILNENIRIIEQTKQW